MLRSIELGIKVGRVAGLRPLAVFQLFSLLGQFQGMRIVILGLFGINYRHYLESLT
jgi:hypothetical protein